MKIIVSAAALAVCLGLAGQSFAQVPSGGADAKGNAPLKHAHTVNDGGARAGANSFTQKEAQTHIAHAGYTDVSVLTKGKDGVWRGSATKDGAARNVGLDYKGNVVDSGPAGTGQMTGAPAPAMPMASSASGSGTTSSTTTASTASGAAMGGAAAGGMHHRRHHRRHRHHRHHGVMGVCANPAPNGAACSGVDRNHNGISDKEDRAIKAGAKP